MVKMRKTIPGKMYTVTVRSNASGGAHLFYARRTWLWWWPWPRKIECGTVIVEEGREQFFVSVIISDLSALADLKRLPGDSKESKAGARIFLEFRPYYDHVLGAQLARIAGRVDIPPTQLLIDASTAGE